LKQPPKVLSRKERETSKKKIDPAAMRRRIQCVCVGSANSGQKPGLDRLVTSFPGHIAMHAKNA
jgi:hypothetical protein